MCSATSHKTTIGTRTTRIYTDNPRKSAQSASSAFLLLSCWLSKVDDMTTLSHPHILPSSWLLNPEALAKLGFPVKKFLLHSPPQSVYSDTNPHKFRQCFSIKSIGAIRGN